MPGRAADPTSDEDLLARCLRGEQAAWNALVDRYAALMYSIALRYGFGQADAADVFQAVCVTLVEKLGSVREPGGLAGWIVTTTSRECLAVIRRRRRELAVTAAHAGSMASADGADPQPLPEDQLLAVERQHIVRTAVGQLPDNCRRLVEALFTDTPEHPSYRQLADSLGMPPNSLGPTRSRCLQKLRRLLRAGGYD